MDSAGEAVITGFSNFIMEKKVLARPNLFASDAFPKVKCTAIVEG